MIGGWKPGEGGRAGWIGSLLVGVHDDDGALLYSGHVGSGFTQQTLRMLGQTAGAAAPGYLAVRGHDVPPEDGPLRAVGRA